MCSHRLDLEFFENNFSTVAVSVNKIRVNSLYRTHRALIFAIARLSCFHSRSSAYATIIHCSLYRSNLLFLKMAQTQSRSSIFATQPIRPTLFTLMFDDLKQILPRILTAIVDRILTACLVITVQHGVLI